MNWDPNAKKLIFLIGDAAPHGVTSQDMSFEQGCPDGYNYKEEAEKASEENIRIYTISGSGMDPIGIKVWKQIAEITGGEYQRLTYERKDVDQYYREEGIDAKWAATAKADADYDRSSNSIVTNTFGSIAKATIMHEAQEAGVSYEEVEEIEGAEDGSWIDSGDIIEETEKPVPVEITEKEVNRSISDFFRNVFSRLTFWS